MELNLACFGPEIVMLGTVGKQEIQKWEFVSKVTAVLESHSSRCQNPFWANPHFFATSGEAVLETGEKSWGFQPAFRELPKDNKAS